MSFAYNKRILTHVKDDIIKPLNDMVEWDRYSIKADNDSGFIYGWIKKENEELYDFIVVRFWMAWEAGKLYCNFDTSSEKHSKEIGRRLGSHNKIDAEHRSASEIPEANLVKWQKVPKMVLGVSLACLLLLNILVPVLISNITPANFRPAIKRRMTSIGQDIKQGSVALDMLYKNMGYAHLVL